MLLVCGECYEPVSRAHAALSDRLKKASDEPRVVNESDAAAKQWLKDGADALLARAEALLERVAQLEQTHGSTRVPRRSLTCGRSVQFSTPLCPLRRS